MDVVEEKSEYNIGVENSEDSLIDNFDGLHRRLSNRQIQFITIGGNLSELLAESRLLTCLIQAPSEQRCLFHRMGFLRRRISFSPPRFPDLCMYARSFNSCVAEMTIFMVWASIVFIVCVKMI